MVVCKRQLRVSATQVFSLQLQCLTVQSWVESQEPSGSNVKCQADVRKTAGKCHPGNWKCIANGEREYSRRLVLAEVVRPVVLHRCHVSYRLRTTWWLLSRAEKRKSTQENFGPQENPLLSPRLFTGVVLKFYHADRSHDRSQYTRKENSLIILERIDIAATHAKYKSAMTKPCNHSQLKCDEFLEILWVLILGND